jgi:hypothetical protein
MSGKLGGPGAGPGPDPGGRCCTSAGLSCDGVKPVASVGGGSGMATPGIRAGGGGGRGPTGSTPGKPVYADTAGGISGGAGLGPS